MTPSRRSALGALTVVLVATISACSGSSTDRAQSTESPSPLNSSSAVGTSAAGNVTMSYDSPEAAAIVAAMEAAMATHHLRALIVRVTVDGKDIYTGAIGESMAGVPATPDMHVRNGSVAFTYIGTILAKMAGDGALTLDDPLARYFPDLPYADTITLRMLANMTSGYADYVYSPQITTSTSLTPFRQYTTDELLAIGLGEPMMYQPGTNWGYSHTNYLILAKVLEKITGKPMADVMQEYIIGPMGLANTTSSLTPAIPSPVLHSFSAERRVGLQVPAGIELYEDATFWNPSWTTANGAVMTSDITDLATTAQLVGSGELVTPEMFEQQTGNSLAGTGERSDECPVCRHLTETRSYGMGIQLVNGWLTQTKNFAGQGGSIGYLPTEKIAIAVVPTYAPAAFDETGAYKNASDAVMVDIAAVLTTVAPVG